MPDTARLHPTLESMLRQAAAWEDEALRRRQLTAVDAAADVLMHCAAELRARVELEARATRRVTVAEYCRVLEVEAGRRVTAQTVRTWIREGVLAAERLGRDYLILRDARPRLLKAA